MAASRTCGRASTSSWISASTSRDEARALAAEVADKLLANPVIESYRDRGCDEDRSMKFAVVVFPGSNCDHDAYHAAKHVLGAGRRVRLAQGHRVSRAPTSVILPGGFSHGDYLRTGAIARFSPVMRGGASVRRAGGPVLGICNGFQILLEAGLLPGAMLRNAGLKFRCEHVHVRVEQTDTPFTLRLRRGQVLQMPIAHGEGNYFAPPDVLDALEANRQVVFRYCDAAGR